MAKDPSDLIPFTLRPGVAPFGGSGWRGIDTESDPGSIDPNSLVRGDNIRIKGRNLITRPGLTAKITLSDKPVQWMKELPTESARMWASILGCTGAFAENGYELAKIDRLATPMYQKYVVSFKSAAKFVPLGIYGSDLWAGEESTLRLVRQVATPYGVTALDIMGANPLVSAKSVGTTYKINCLIEFDGKFFIGCEHLTSPATLSKIISFDGLEFHDDVTGIASPLAFGVFRDQLIVGFDATAGIIKTRERGSTYPATWTSHVGVGYGTSPYQNSMQTVGTKLWIASGADTIWSWDGTTLALERTIVGCDVTEGVNALCLHDGLLHYGWNDNTAGLSSRLGRYDPDSTANDWVDTYKDITTAVSTFRRLSSMVSWRKQIWIGGSNRCLIATAVNDVLGTIETIQGGGSTTNFNIRQLIVVR